ncbi:MAG: sulfatase-like hydrolase/transferase, partial [Methylococcaceae bacterium]|nr:sulfatase-like hydrolase/transferase [Methylococcaceae bacterium]
VSPAPFDGTVLKSAPPEDFNARNFLPDTVKRLKGDPDATLSPETTRAMIAAYDECIQYVDDGLGRVFEALKQRGLYDNTLIIITADHGEEFMEHGLIGHGESLYDELIHVPLIVKFPCPGPHCAPRTVTSQVELVDIFPTVMDAIGVEPPDGLVGTKLSEPGPVSRVAYSELAPRIALRTSDWKWVYDEKEDSGRLFNLGDDPGEINDLASLEPAVRDLLSTRLLDFSATRKPGIVANGKAIVADETMLENLKALGYVK